MIRLFKHYIPQAVLLFGLCDLALLLLAGDLAWHARAWQIGTDAGPWSERLLPLAGFVIICWLSLVAIGLYSPEALRSPRYAFARSLVALSVGGIALAVIDFILPTVGFWRSTLLYALGLAAFFIGMVRIALSHAFDRERFKRRVVVLGAGARAARLKAMAQCEDAGFAIVGFIAMSEAHRILPEAVNRDQLGDLGAYVARLRASEVVLALEERRNALPLADLLRVRTRGVPVHEVSSFLERETGRVDLDTLNPSWLIFSDGFSAGRRYSSIAKRLFDILVSGLLLLVTFPVIALFAVLVKLDSKGPAFFRQQRVGLYGRRFSVIKLRSMRTDAEKDGAKWASENDPRITRIGRFIRKVRIDELPQTWSVLKGEMSFVGPRPEVPQFVNDLDDKLPYYAERHMVKPGITGWAQINYPYGASMEDARHKLEYDLYYAKNYTPFLDLLILLQTLRVILFPSGAR
ncbi:TIGR03013 family XrtA/PEP-CTERM system glycosyltransferase [Alteriqipengyuania lutimaris]|uniref:TIGR03013 family PEP-CTERM/XrtA system glycosyltransferase n=1 Tax=Alteriqipengyuania lutimaris TaxID=1538146 RepID=A0A395LLQ8_9SPHN|nr:TIGR03013 family XrtA/PEP-CTERM system glycosyltransferase [Alteriqipengyuania lutimaris]MBB3033036.1 sugar transferase (PEP-CTERM system associated) [Alteriqipengyuania lutimaris]RDS77892.1 TIGR03013 family PEP-CTERM/XrtA system glycosyltransferase [Alteriqipengyuania lutimaris]